MKVSGTTHPLRIGVLLTALAIVTTACSSSSSTKAETTPGTTRSATESPSPSTPQSVPAGCHTGVADSVESTVAILTDPADCPGSVNAYWKSQLGEKWTDPVFIPYRDGQIPKDACGAETGNAADFADNAFYCPSDDTIAYSQDLLNSLFKAGGAYQPVVVLEHELGHRADHLAGVVGPISRSEENQADCSAGVTTANARTAHRLPFIDVLKSAKQFFEIGDTRHFGSELAFSPDAHGTPNQRLAAFTLGYFAKISVCRRIGQSPDGSIR